MHTHKVFSFFLLVSLLVGMTFSPVQAEAQPAWLHTRINIMEKVEANQSEAPMVTITVCANGCDFSSIQDDINAAKSMVIPSTWLLKSTPKQLQSIRVLI